MAVGLTEGASYFGHFLHLNHFFSVLPFERPHKGSTQALWNQSTVFSLLLYLSCPSSHSCLSPDKRPPSFNFQKARWNDFALFFHPHCPYREECSSLSLFCAAAIFISLALNAAKSSISLGRIKHQPKAWWSAEVKEAVSKNARLSLPLTEAIKIVRLTSPLPDMLRVSSPRLWLRHGRRFALLSRQI